MINQILLPRRLNIVADGGLGKQNVVIFNRRSNNFPRFGTAISAIIKTENSSLAHTPQACCPQVNYVVCMCINNLPFGKLLPMQNKTPNPILAVPSRQGLFTITDTPSGITAIWASCPFSLSARPNASLTSAAVSNPISSARARYSSHIT